MRVAGYKNWARHSDDRVLSILKRRLRFTSRRQPRPLQWTLIERHLEAVVGDCLMTRRYLTELRKRTLIRPNFHQPFSGVGELRMLVFTRLYIETKNTRSPPC